MTHTTSNPLARRTRRSAAWLAVALLGLALALPGAAQDVRLPGLRGGQLTEGDLAQGASIVVIWASWSPRGKDIVARVNAIERRWGSRARVVTVNFQEDRGTVEEFLAGQNLSVPVYLDADGAFSKKHAVTTLPGLLVIRDGNVAFRGRLTDDPDTILSENLGR
jgi:hypothetical protein